MKKIISIFLVISMLASVFAMCGVTAFAENDILDYLSYEIIDGEVTITDTDKSISGDIEIPSEIEGYPVTKIGTMAFIDCFYITSVKIPSTVRVIGNNAFSWCWGLTDITIPDGVTIIEDYAFHLSYNIKTVSIPASVSWIGSWAFGDYGLIESVSIGVDSADSSKQTRLSPDAFELTQIEYLSIGPGVVDFNMFGSEFTKVDENNPVYSSDENGVLFNKEKTTLIGYPRASENAEYVIPDSVTTIGDGAFLSSSALTDITIHDGVTSIGAYAFDNTGYYNNPENWEDGVLYINNHLVATDTESLTECEIKEGTLTISEEAFLGCEKLEKIKLPDSLKTIGDFAFCGCLSLKSITIPELVSYIDAGTFSETALEEIYINSPECVIFYDAETIPADAVIYGYANSPAQLYAEIYMRNFVAIATAECAHTFGEWIVDEEVSCTEKGFAHRICTLCNGYEFDVLEATGHKDADNNKICDSCDEVLAQSLIEKITAFFNRFILLFKNFFDKLFGFKG